MWSVLGLLGLLLTIMSVCINRLAAGDKPAANILAENSYFYSINPILLAITTATQMGATNLIRKFQTG